MGTKEGTVKVQTDFLWNLSNPRRRERKEPLLQVETQASQRPIQEPQTTICSHNKEILPPLGAKWCGKSCKQGEICDEIVLKHGYCIDPEYRAKRFGG